MGMMSEFKEFAVKGNVVELAVAVVIGAAFGKIVTSLVEDIIMPIISAIVGNVNFDNYYTMLTGKVAAGTAVADAAKSGAVLAWGKFLTVSVNFLIVAWALFMVVRMINKLKKA